MDTMSIVERTSLVEYLDAADAHCRFLAYCVKNIHDPSFQTLCRVQKAHTEEIIVTLSQYLNNPDADWEGGHIYGTRNFPM
jgi:hypothetical protein